MVILHKVTLLSEIDPRFPFQAAQTQLSLNPLPKTKATSLFFFIISLAPRCLVNQQVAYAHVLALFFAQCQQLCLSS